MDRPSNGSRKPKALFLSPEAPYPAIGGGPLRSASLLEYLARHFAVHAIIFRHLHEHDPAQALPAGLVQRLDVLDLPHHPKTPVARAVRNSRRLFLGRPPLIDRFAGYGEAISSLISKCEYDIAIIEHFWCAPYVQQLRSRSKRVILDLHNIESVWHRSLSEGESKARAWALRRFATASVALERKWWPEFDAILATSQEDGARVRDIFPDANVAVYPNALPCIAKPPREELEEIVFSGNLEYPPNAGALRFFSKNIWPILRSRWPNLKWKIVGKHPEAIAGFVRDDPRIQMTGFVDDAIPLLAEARIAVVPMLSGSGTRIKILEAWAAGTPVVSTSLGAEGLECRDGEHLLIANQPERFANAVASLLESPQERMRIGAAGRELYEQNYTWNAAWGILDTVLRNHVTRQGI